MPNDKVIPEVEYKEVEYKPLTNTETIKANELYNVIIKDELQWLTSDDNKDNKGNLIKVKFQNVIKTTEDGEEVVKYAPTNYWRMLQAKVKSELVIEMGLTDKLLIENCVAEFLQLFEGQCREQKLYGKVYNYFLQKDNLNVFWSALYGKLKRGSFKVTIDGIEYNLPKLDGVHGATGYYIDRVNNTRHCPAKVNWSNVTESTLDEAV